MNKDEKSVFVRWCSLRTSIGKTEPTLTSSRKKYICHLLSARKTEDVILILDYFSKSKDDYVLFMKTEKDGRYTGLEYIFRPSKFYDKLEKAKDWRKKNKKYEAKDLHLPYRIVYGDKS